MGGDYIQMDGGMDGNVEGWNQPCNQHSRVAIVRASCYIVGAGLRCVSPLQPTRRSPMSMLSSEWLMSLQPGGELHEREAYRAPTEPCRVWVSRSLTMTSEGWMAVVVHGEKTLELTKDLMEMFTPATVCSCGRGARRIQGEMNVTSFPEGRRKGSRY